MTDLIFAEDRNTVQRKSQELYQFERLAERVKHYMAPFKPSEIKIFVDEHVDIECNRRSIQFDVRLRSTNAFMVKYFEPMFISEMLLSLDSYAEFLGLQFAKGFSEYRVDPEPHIVLGDN